MTNKTDEIFQLTAPYANPYQGSTKRLLFVCSAGLLRSATAANLYANKGYNTRSAGSHVYALIPISANLIYWADKIFFVNEENYLAATEKFEGDKINDVLQSKCVTLDIPDRFSYNDPELVKCLEDQIGEIDD
jgi:protein-tyrosine phosphatase